jgi:RNA polymerase sigma factor (sigma-70 family)
VAGPGDASAPQALIERARQGDAGALDELVRRIQDLVYGLALRMLWHPEDARDATQEILVRVVTHLGDFRGESAVRTWVYRIACNYLKTARRTRAEAQGFTFERFGRELDEGLADRSSAGEPAADESLLLEEVKLGCTHGMLLCLDRDHRLAYILGEILELDGSEAARVLEIEPATFRKRLSRARADVTTFVMAKCGLANPAAACRCRRRVATAVRMGRVDPARLLFATNAARAREFPEVLREIRKLEALRRAAALYRSHATPRAPEDFAGRLRALLAGGTRRGAATRGQPGSRRPAGARLPPGGRAIPG